MSVVKCTDDNSVIDEPLLNNENEHKSVDTNSIMSNSTNSLSIPNDLFAESFLNVHNHLRKLACY